MHAPRVFNLVESLIDVRPRRGVEEPGSHARRVVPYQPLVNQCALAIQVSVCFASKRRCAGLPALPARVGARESCAHA